jgi:Flp pilus assembly protein CpaB
VPEGLPFHEPLSTFIFVDAEEEDLWRKRRGQRRRDLRRRRLASNAPSGDATRLRRLPRWDRSRSPANLSEAGTARYSPNGRAVLGGFLIAASGVGLFAAYQQSNAAPQTRYVVTTRSLAPGEIVQRDDLGLAPAEVPPEMADEMTRDWAPLVGRVTTAALGRHQFLNPASLAEPGTSDGPARRVALELTRAGAIDGALQAGAIVDVLAGTDGDTKATVVARRARVVALNDSSSGDLGQMGSLVVTIEVQSERALAAVVGANTAGTITLATPSAGTPAHPTPATILADPAEPAPKASSGGTDGD